MDDRIKVSRSVTYDIPDSAVVFRIAWHFVTAQPGFVLSEHSEAESTIFKGKALFTGKLDDHEVTVRVWVEEAQKAAEITSYGDDESVLTSHVEGLANSLRDALVSYRQLDEVQKTRLQRALIARTCWDRIVHLVLTRAPAEAIYIQVAHGREMFIRAIEGGDMHPLPLSTTPWLQKLESMPRDQPLPGDFATALAKKSVEWKQETSKLLQKFIPA